MSITCTDMAKIIETAQAWSPSQRIAANVATEGMSCRRTRLLVSYGSMRLPSYAVTGSHIISAVRVWEPCPPHNTEPIEYILTVQTPVRVIEDALELLARRTHVLRNVSFER